MSIDGRLEKLINDVQILLAATNHSARFYGTIFELNSSLGKCLLPIVLRNLREDLQQAIELANQQAKANDIVLLSPFCASLDMFNNFEQRGNYFMEMARARLQ